MFIKMEYNIYISLNKNGETDMKFEYVLNVNEKVSHMRMNF